MIRRIPHLEPPPQPQQGDLDELEVRTLERIDCQRIR